ncbi:MAG: DNA replication/repair protein RecF [Bacteroidales bacterium]|nr:DNA replication/repair protein RecF [Bacteroidales bacterium]
MYLHKISLTGFKSYQQADLVFSDKINCIVGNNGVGKTNLLDAIHYLSFCKSFYSAMDIQNIHHGDEYFAINGTFIRDNEGSELVQCIQRKNQRKKFLLNKKEYDRLANHIGNFPLVMISPYDRDLINEGSDLRRRYIDSVISQFDKFYLDNLIQYNKALAQRNALLKSFDDNHYFDPVSLEIWDEQMIHLGESVLSKRIEFLGKFIPIFQQYYKLLGNGFEIVNIRYATQLAGVSYREKFKSVLSIDRSVQYSTVGIHKDDLEFSLDGFPIKKFGSQGQQKSFVIAIKLAQFEYTRSVKGYKPILLLDDVFDKLDDIRVSQLIKLVSEESFGQVFITDTSEERIRKMFDTMMIDHKIFSIPLSLAGDSLSS